MSSRLIALLHSDFGAAIAGLLMLAYAVWSIR